jgi:hypothetical protein
VCQRILAVAIVVVTASACASGGDALEREDLPVIILQADEAPEGTRKVADVGGEQDLDVFARDATERAALVEDGFLAGYVVYFAPEASFAPGGSADDDAVAFQAIAGLFRDADGASSSLHRYLDDLRTRQIESVVTLEAVDVGEESFGLRGRAPADGSPLLVYLFRVRNVILVVSGSGPVDEAAVAAAAEAMAARATGGTVRAEGPVSTAPTRG